ncbi:MAG: CheY-like chemotaxis protein [Polyangiales bacterium]|jgi:CheY-like chemotaxis protein
MRRALVVDPSTVARDALRLTLETEGWEVSFADAGNALREASALVPDLIFLDAAEGAGLGVALKSTDNLSDIPMILMVAEADSERLVQQAAADDAVKKPFSPDAIRTVAAHLLRTTRNSAPHRPPGAEKAPASERLEQALFAAAKLVGETYPGADAQRELARVIVEAYDETFDVSFRGRIEHLPLGDVLQMLAQGHEGVLYVERADSESVRICLRGGLVDFVDYEGLGPEFLLGRYLSRVALVELNDIERAARKPRWLGRTLVEEGTITREDLVECLREQSSELLYEALRWHRATFRFERYAVLPEAEDANLGLTPTGLLMEGLRRVDEWRLIEQQVHNFDLVYLRDSRAATIEKLSDLEEQVLGAIDDNRSVRELIEHTGLAPFDVCKALYQFVQARVIRHRR